MDRISEYKILMETYQISGSMVSLWNIWSKIQVEKYPYLLTEALPSVLNCSIQLWEWSSSQSSSYEV